jgi:F0F1-type ATP synthase assembly protein I
VSQRDNEARNRKKPAKSNLERTAEAFQENVTRSAPYAAASYTLVGAIAFLGFVGYALDRWRDTSPWFLVSGLILGIIVGFYDLAKVVWRR